MLALEERSAGAPGVVTFAGLVAAGFGAGRVEAGSPSLPTGGFPFLARNVLGLVGERVVCPNRVWGMLLALLGWHGSTKGALQGHERLAMGHAS